MSVLELNDVHYTYSSQYQTQEVLKGISYSFEPGKLYAIMGTSGSGKSTLLSLLAGLDTPTSGKIKVGDISTDEIDLDEYRRRKVAVIYQNFRLFPLLTIVENVMYPMELAGMDTEEARDRAEKLVKYVGLGEEKFDRFPTMLSGGEQQRVAIARALGRKTRIILADEPTGNLDSENTKLIFKILMMLAHKYNYCVIVVTHDTELGELSDICVRIKDGSLLED